MKNILLLCALGLATTRAQLTAYCKTDSECATDPKYGPDTCCMAGFYHNTEGKLVLDPAMECAARSLEGTTQTIGVTDPQDYTLACFETISQCSDHKTCEKFDTTTGEYCCGIFLLEEDMDLRPEYNQCMLTADSGTNQTIHNEKLFAACRPTITTCLTNLECENKLGTGYCCAELTTTYHGKELALQGCAKAENHGEEESIDNITFKPYCNAVPCTTTTDCDNVLGEESNYCCGSLTTINNIGLNQTTT